MEAEIWKDVVVYGHKVLNENDLSGLYEVSSFGRVRRTETGRILSPRDVGGGYFQIGLRFNKKQFYLLVHRLVVMAFIGAPPTPDTQVNHLDRNPSNNHMTNLTWTTHVENLEYSVSQRLKEDGDYAQGYRMGLQLILDGEKGMTDFCRGLVSAGKLGSLKSNRRIQKILDEVNFQINENSS